MEHKTLRKEILEVTAPKQLIVGDPVYFDDGLEAKLCYVNNKLPKDAFAELILEEAECSSKMFGDEKMTFTMIEASLIVRKRSIQGIKIQGAHEEGCHIPALEKGEQVLGCDTASFELNGDVFHIGGDGAYGSVTEYKNNEAVVLSVAFPGDLFDFDEIKNRLSSNFGPVWAERTIVEAVPAVNRDL